MLALRLCPLCFPAQPFDTGAISMEFLQVMCSCCCLERALLCHHLGQMFSPIWTVWGFGVQSPAARWSCRRHCPLGHPSSNLFSKPLADGASQSWCNPADSHSCCLFPSFFIDSVWTSSLAVMDFVQLGR